MDYCKQCDKIHIFDSCNMTERNKAGLIKNWQNTNYTVGILTQASQFFVQNLNYRNISGCQDQLNILEKYKSILNEDVIICYNDIRFYILEHVKDNKNNQEELFKMANILALWINDIFLQRSQAQNQSAPSPAS